MQIDFVGLPHETNAFAPVNADYHAFE